MSRNVNDLTNATLAKALLVIEYCKDAGVDILIYNTLRTLEEQARLYRKGRSYSSIKAKMRKLSSRGFGLLADVIQSVGPQHGSIVTNAAPGESYHNYGMAFDAVPIIDGKAMWNDLESYKIYGDAVRNAGMIWGGDWTKFNDKPHAQIAKGGNPLKMYDVNTIYKMLKLL